MHTYSGGFNVASRRAGRFSEISKKKLTKKLILYMTYGQIYGILLHYKKEKGPRGAIHCPP